MDGTLFFLCFRERFYLTKRMRALIHNSLASYMLISLFCIDIFKIIIVGKQKDISLLLKVSLIKLVGTTKSSRKNRSWSFSYAKSLN